MPGKPRLHCKKKKKVTSSKSATSGIVQRNGQWHARELAQGQSYLERVFVRGNSSQPMAFKSFAFSGSQELLSHMERRHNKKSWSS